MSIRSIRGFDLLSTRVAMVPLAIGLLYAPFVIAPTEQRLVTTMLIYGIYAIGYNLIFGYTGMVSFGHGAFFGGGMYLTALIYLHTGVTNTLLVLLGATVGTLLLGLTIGLISTQSRGVFFAILTFICAEIIYTIVFHSDFTGGSNGLSFSIPSLNFLPGLPTFSAYEIVPVYYTVTIFTIIILTFMRKFVNSPLGTVLKGIRENPERIHYLGFKERRFRVLSFSISAGISGFAGGLLAIADGFVGPSILGLDSHGFVIIYTILGGSGSVIGPLVGAAGLRFIQDQVAAQITWWFIPIGVIFIFIVIFIPEGIGGKVSEWLGI